MKKFRYIKIKDDKPKKNKKKNEKIWRNIGHALTVVGTTISSMMLILVIMLCIVATVVVVYILDFAKTNSFDINLKEAETKFTTMVYAYDEDRQEIEIKRLANVENRVWVNYENISKNIINAVVAKEDQRFWEHQGVDWRRTVFALVQDAFKLPRAGEGGSTITQQLVKNITEDDERTWERKLREIFRAQSLEEHYTKEDILESYLNKIWFGKMIYGVEAASQTYFGKSAAELDIAEAAILSGIIKSPNVNRPNGDLKACKENQLVALYAMYEQGYISLKEYEEAKVEQVKFVPVVYGDAFGYIDPRSIPEEDPDDPDDDPDDLPDDDIPYEAYKWNEGTYEVSQNWYTDAAIRQVIEDYAALKGKTFASARDEIYNGGYKIYTNMNIEKQASLEEKYRDPYLVVTSYDKNVPEEELIQSSFVLLDYTGTVVALAGGLGEKKGDNCFNRASVAERAPGSTMKPISPYSMGVQNNFIHYSQLIPDKGIPIAGTSKPWPDNYGGGQSGALYIVWNAVRFSRNTVPVRITTQLTPQVLYNHLTQNLGFTTLVESDIDIAPMTLGALSRGVKMTELAAAYQIFGNGGIHYEPKLYSRVLDSKNNVILEQDYYGNQAIDSDTAWVVNRMLYTVVNHTNYANLGPYAKLPNVEVIGKTGTSNDEKNLLFVGMTPDYVGVVWMGIDNGDNINERLDHRYHSQIWHDVMVELQDTSEKKVFAPDPTVLERHYCLDTGLLASNSCVNQDIGYYRASYVPQFCSGDHKAEQTKIWDYWNSIDEEIRSNLPKN